MKFLKMLSVFAFLCCGAAQAQTLNFTSNVQSGNGSVTPTLTWSTTPAAQSCTASGDWTGSKAASGTQALAAITSSKTYNLTCTWVGDTTATLNWTAPTTNTDGTAYTDPKGYRIVRGSSSSNLATLLSTTTPAITTYVNNGLSPGTYCYGVYAVNQRDVESVISNVACKTLTAAPSANRSVGITVNPQPSPAVLSLE